MKEFWVHVPGYDLLPVWPWANHFTLLAHLKSIVSSYWKVINDTFLSHGILWCFGKKWVTKYKLNNQVLVVTVYWLISRLGGYLYFNDVCFWNT